MTHPRGPDRRRSRNLRARHDQVVVDDRHLIHRGAAVYHRPDGPFTYGDFTVRSIKYDLTGPTAD